MAEAQKMIEDILQVAHQDNGLPKARVNLEYWDESMEILRTTANTQEAIREVENYL